MPQFAIRSHTKVIIRSAKTVFGFWTFCATNCFSFQCVFEILFFPFLFVLSFHWLTLFRTKLEPRRQKNCVFGELNDINLDYLFYLVGDFQKFQCKNNKQIIFDKKKQQNFFLLKLKIKIKILFNCNENHKCEKNENDKSTKPGILE